MGPNKEDKSFVIGLWMMIVLRIAAKAPARRYFQNILLRFLEESSSLTFDTTARNYEQQNECGGLDGSRVVVWRQRGNEMMYRIVCSVSYYLH